MNKQFIVPRSYKLIDYNGSDGRFKTINPNEAIILSHLPTKWKWIVRDNQNNLYLHTHKPHLRSKIKAPGLWDWSDNPEAKVMKFPYTSLFKCIKMTDTEPTNIDKLLKENII